MIERLRKISYFCAYAMATIPLWHYIRDGRILAGMIAVVVFAYVMVVLSSVQAAQPILSSEKAKISFPRWLPDRPKYHKWWMIVRRTLKWHLLLVPPKMGLALGFVHYFHSHWMYNFNSAYGNINSPATLQNFFLSPYVYFSHAYQNFIPAYPQWETIGIAMCVLTTLAIAKCSLWSASFLMTTSTKQVYSEIKKKILSILYYLVLVFSTIGFLFFFTSQYRNNTCSRYTSCTPVDRATVRIGETIHSGIFTLTGEGVLLSANIMRPVGENTAFAKTTSREYSTEEQRWIYDYDNRLFVARQVVAGLLGLMLYAGVTWVILWFVDDEEVLS